MPMRPKSRNCLNCTELFSYTPRTLDEAEGPRIYCSRRCTLQFQRARRANRLTPEQKARLASVDHAPSHMYDSLQTPMSAEGARLRQQYLKGEGHAKR